MPKRRDDRMPERVNPRLRRAVFDIVRNQLSANNPPETMQTLNRLQAEGHSKDEAMDLIACVVVSEIHGVMSENRAFDNGRYVAALLALPTLPWDKDD